MVYYNGHPICDDNHATSSTWDINDAIVVCKMFGFSNATNSYRNCGDLGIGKCSPAGHPFALSGFKCTGNETHILDCPHERIVASHCGNSGVTNGDGSDEVAVECA